MSATEPASASLSKLSSQSVSVVESCSTDSVALADITSYNNISPTSVITEETSEYVNASSDGLISFTQTEQSSISDKPLYTGSVSTDKPAIISEVFSVSGASQLSKVESTSRFTSAEELTSSSSEAGTSTSVTSSLDVKSAESSVVAVTSERLSLVSSSPYVTSLTFVTSLSSVTSSPSVSTSPSDDGSSATVDLSPPEPTASVLYTSQVSSIEDYLQESGVSATPTLLQSAHSTSTVASVRVLPSQTIAKRSLTSSSVLSTSSLGSSWETKPSAMSSTLTYLFSSATVTSSVILSSPPTTTYKIPGPALQTESLYIIIPVCLVVLLMLAVVVIMCLRWRRQVKKTYVEPPPQDLWVNTHTEMSVVPTVSTSTIPGVQVDTNLPFNPGDAVCHVLHPFPAQLDNQISLREGDFIKIFEKEGNGWWRGVNQAGESGWFPGSYVETIKCGLRVDDDKKRKSRVSSFLLKKKDSILRRQMGVDNTHCSQKNDQSQNITPDVMTQEKTTVMQKNSVENGKYYAVYSYTAASKGEISLVEGEFVMAQERDRNGWMRGKKVATGEVGWFPAVYVDEIQDVASLSSESTISGHVTYDQLNKNRKKLSSQDWIGIEHHAIYSYVAEMPEDLSFDAGDKIFIYETMDNGWWLGSKGKQVGWLPGTYLQLVEPVTEDENRSDTSSEDKFRSSSEEIIMTPDPENKPKPIRKAPPPPPPHKTSHLLRKQKSEPNMNTPANEQTYDTLIKSSRYEPIKFQRLSSNSVKPMRRAPAPPGQISSSVHVNISDTAERVPLSENSNQQPTLPNFEPPSPDNFVSVSLPSESLSTSSEKLQIKPGKKPQVPKRFAKPKLIRRKSTKLTNLAENSRPSRPVPPRPAQPLSKPVRSSKYVKRNISLGHSAVDDKINIGNRDSRISGTSHSERISSTLPPDIVLSSSGDQYSVTDSTTQPPLPLPPVPQDLEMLTSMSLDEQYNESNRDTPPPALPLPPFPQDPETSHSVEGQKNISNEPQFIPKLKIKKVIKVPPPIVPLPKLQRPHIDSDVNVSNSESQSIVIPTPSDEERNLKNKNIIRSESDSDALTEHRIDSSKEQIISDSKSNDLRSTSTSSVENLQKSVKSQKENVNKPRFTVPPVKPPPPKSPPPRVQRMVRKREPVDINKKKTLWRAKRNYLATAKGELSFEEGSFIKEISKTVGQPGWCVGMLVDGTTGLYHQSYVEESLIKEQSHV